MVNRSDSSRGRRRTPGGPALTGLAILAVSFGAVLLLDSKTAPNHKPDGDRTAGQALLLPPAEPLDDLGRGFEEDVDARSDWFFFQRAYPFGSIPADARRTAWEPLHRESALQLSPLANKAWTPIGPSPTTSAYVNNWGVTSGRVNAIAVSPNDSRLVLVGASTGGIWRSTDGGASFKPVSDDQADLAVGSIAFSESNPSIVFAGMGDPKSVYLGSGVLKSTDGGLSWDRINNGSLPSPGTVTRIAVDPVDSNRIYVAQYSKLSGNTRVSSGFFRSTDGGSNWTLTLTGLARDIAIDSLDRSSIYLAMSRIDPADPSQPAGIYHSTDAGVTWASVYSTPYDRNRTFDIKVATTEAAPNTVYVWTGGTTGDIFTGGLLISTDGGTTWSDRGAAGVDLAQFGYNTYITVDPTEGKTIYVGSRDVYKSTDGGFSWANLTRSFTGAGGQFSFSPGVSKAHPDQHAFAFSPNNPSVFYIGNDGGVYKSNDGGDSFLNLNPTLTLTQFVGISLHPTNRFISYGGTQDNGTQRRFGLSAWYEFAPGDGGHSVINPLFPSMVFTTYIRGSIFRFGNDGGFVERQVAWNSTFGEPDPGGRLGFYPPFVGNEVDERLYFGTWRFFISTNLGDTWTAPAGDLDFTKGVTQSGSDVISAIGVSPADTDVIYTGSVQGRAMATTDGGQSWADVTAGLPDRSITGIAADPTAPTTAYVSVSGFGSPHVFKTTDAGIHWSSVSANLPDVPANAILVHPIVSNTIYVGTDIGVFRTTSGGATWGLFNKGVPPAVITGFSSQPGGLIQVSTYGRGAYEIDAGVPRPSIASVSFNGKKLLTVTGSEFGSGASVMINGVDRTSHIKSGGDSLIKLKGKINKLGLIEGDNAIQVIGSSGAGSNVFIFRL
jgi:photosystem II stability/assembly factor-like uncharacterized protein